MTDHFLLFRELSKRLRINKETKCWKETQKLKGCSWKNKLVSRGSIID